MTTAYRYTPQGDTVRVEKTTYPSNECARPHDAAALVLAGTAATVAGSDAVVMRALLTKAGKAVRP
jgi:hypothetical protein